MNHFYLSGNIISISNLKFSLSPKFEVYLEIKVKDTDSKLENIICSIVTKEEIIEYILKEVKIDDLVYITGSINAQNIILAKTIMKF